MEIMIDKNWISISDKLPKKGRSVLCYISSTHDTFHYMEVSYLKDNNNWAGIMLMDFTTVTHWMELPEPPKGK